MTAAAAETARTDAALRRLLATDINYGYGFSNHGPMCIEALEHLGMTSHIDAYLDANMPKLTPKEPDAAPVDDWRSFIAATAGALAAKAGGEAGHGLLRFAHSVRAIEQTDTEVRRADLDEAARYWAASTGLAGSRTLTGNLRLADVLQALPRLGPPPDDGSLSDALHAAAADPDVTAAVESLAAPANIADLCNELALAAADRFTANDGLAQFTFMHGVTVPTMAQQLLPYLDETAAAELVAAVASFVLYAIAAFDNGAPSPQLPPPSINLPELAEAAALSAEDHTIKFTDACLTLAERTGDRRALQAAEFRYRNPPE